MSIESGVSYVWGLKAEKEIYLMWYYTPVILSIERLR